MSAMIPFALAAVLLFAGGAGRAEELPPGPGLGGEAPLPESPFGEEDPLIMPDPGEELLPEGPDTLLDPRLAPPEPGEPTEQTKPELQPASADPTDAGGRPRRASVSDLAAT